MHQLLTVSEVAQRLKVARQTVYKFLNSDPDFPKPIRLGSRTARWRESDLDSYLAHRETAPIGAPSPVASEAVSA